MIINDMHEHYKFLYINFIYNVYTYRNIVHLLKDIFLILLTVFPSLQ